MNCSENNYDQTMTSINQRGVRILALRYYIGVDNRPYNEHVPIGW